MQHHYYGAQKFSGRQAPCLISGMEQFYMYIMINVYIVPLGQHHTHSSFLVLITVIGSGRAPVRYLSDHQLNNDISNVLYDLFHSRTVSILDGQTPHR